MPKAKHPSFAMRMVERYRAEIVVLVVLPISFLIYALKVIQRKLFSPRPELHESRVQRVAAAVRAAVKDPTGPALRTDRNVFSSHSVRNSDKSQSRQVKLSDLRAILALDTKAGILHVEPGATVGEVTDYLLERKMQLECCLEMEDATLGGLAMAQGMTTHSHVCGLLSETVVEYEVVTANGTILTVTEGNPETADLFRALPLSHGTLGLLVSLKLRVVASSTWVKLRYIPCRSRAALQASYTRVLDQARRGDEDTPFFVESLAFGPNSAVLMEGFLADELPSQDSACVVNRIGRWYKPWFFKHVEQQLTQSKPTVEYIPIRDYLMRHDRSMCMTMATIIPYGNEWWFRWVLGWLLPPQMSFLKSSHTKETREASIRKQCYQDVAFPAAQLPHALSLVDELFGIYPLMIYPCMVVSRSQGKGGGMLRVHTETEAKDSEGKESHAKEVNYLNLGIYGVPPAITAAPAALFPMVTRVRRLEAWLRSVGGFQHTYCDSFQTEAEFEEMFDHRLYDLVRQQYDADDVFPRVYGKTRPEMDVFAWLAEEELECKKRK